MGVLRLFLAITVLLWHCPEGLVARVLHPALAVQCFYAISGFLMQVAIPRYKNKGGDWHIAFYKSRLARLIPLYWLVTALTFLIFGNGIAEAFWHSKDTFGLFVFVYNNIFLLGQDIIRFFSYNTVTHQFYVLPPFTENMSSAIDHNAIFGSNFTIAWQSWTLSVELWFYLLAPFLLFRSSAMVGIILILGIISRYCFAYFGFTHHTFLYGNFLNEISIFLGGALAARFYNYALASGVLNLLIARYTHTPLAIVNLMLRALGVLFLWQLLNYYYVGWYTFPIGGAWGEGMFQVPYRYWFVIIVTILTLPWIFHTFGKWKWDRFIGDLSYPVYISHVFFILCANKSAIPEQYVVAYVLALTLAVSILLIILVERPLDNWRHKRFLKQAKESL